MKKLFAKLCAVVVAACGLSAFADTPTTHGAIWSNIGAATYAGVATTTGSGNYPTSYTVNFGTTSGMAFKSIGGNGKVRLSKITFLKRKNNALAVPTQLTVSQDGTFVTANIVEDATSMVVYGADYPTTSNQFWTGSYGRLVATFDSDVQFDTTKNLTLTFTTTDSNVGLFVIKPDNGVFTAASGYAPAIEIVGDYTANTATPIASFNSENIADGAKSGDFTLSLGTGASITEGVASTTASTSTAYTGLILTADQTKLNAKELAVIVTYDSKSTFTGNTSMLSALWGATNQEFLVAGNQYNQARILTGVTSSVVGTEQANVSYTMPTSGKMMVVFSGVDGCSKGTRVAFATKNDDGTYTGFTHVAYTAAAFSTGKFMGFKIGGSISKINHYYRPGMNISSIEIYNTSDLLGKFTRLDSMANNPTYVGGAGTSTSGVKINLVGNSETIKGGTYYIAANSWSDTQTTVNIEDATLNCLSSFGVGTADYVVSGSSKIYTGLDGNQSFALSQGGAGRNCSFTLKDDAEVIVGGSNNDNSQENQNSVMFGHWAGSTTFTIQDDAKFTAKSQVMVGVTHQDQTININGGTFTAQGIRASANAWSSNNLNLRGGTLCLGDVGITQNGSYKIAVNALEGSSTIKATASTLPISQPITIDAGAMLTIDTDYASEITGTVVNNGTLVLKGKGSFTIPAVSNLTVEEGTTVKLLESAAVLDGTITVLGDASKVTLYRADGTTAVETTSEAITGGTKLTFAPQYTGEICWWDYEFNGNGDSTGTDTTALSWDNPRPFQNSEYVTVEGDNQALHVPARPYRGVSSWPTAATFVMYGKMVGGDKQYELAFGTHDGNCIFLATGDVDNNEVKLCKSTGGTVTELCTMKVSNAQTCNHLYAFVLKTENGSSSVDIYLDGKLIQPYDIGSTFSLGGGFQIASVHGGTCGDYTRPSDTDAATLDWLRVYNVELSEAAMAKMAEEYPYENPNGAYQRTIGDVTEAFWMADGAWTKESSSLTYAKPADGGSVEVTGTTTTSIKVNLDADYSYEALTIDGAANGVLSFTTSGIEGYAGKIKSQGSVTINAPVHLSYAAIDISGVPLTMGDNGYILFDLSSIDLSKIYRTTFIDLTGVASSDYASRIGGTLPTAVPGRTRTLTYNATTQHYGLYVTVSSDAVVATTTADGTTTWTAGDETIDADQAALIATTITKKGEGTLEVAQVAGCNYVIDAGTLQFSSKATTQGTITVNAGATFNMNAKSNGAGFKIVLNGGTLKNSGTGISYYNSQIASLTLTADSTLTVDANMGLVSGSYGASAITANLGGYTLTTTVGSGCAFHVCNTTLSNGTLDIQSGCIEFAQKNSTVSATLKIGAAGILRINSGITATLGTVEFTEGATVQNNGTLTGATVKGKARIAGTFSNLSFDSAWEGTVVLPAITEGCLDLNLYGNANSTVEITSMTAGWVPQNTTFNPTVKLAGNMVIDDCSQGSYTFAKLTGTGIFGFGQKDNAPAGVTITELIGTGVTLSNAVNATMTVGTLTLPADTSVTPGTKLIATAKNPEMTNAAFVLSGVTVGGTAQSLAYYYGDDGIYVASATIGGTGYMTVADAIAVVKASSGTLTLKDITVASGATIPEGYGLNADGELVDVTTQVAKIGDVYYATLAKAVAGASTETTETITLLLKATETALTVDRDVTITTDHDYLSETAISLDSAVSLRVTYTARGNKKLKVSATTGAEVKPTLILGGENSANDFGLDTPACFRDINLKVDGMTQLWLEGNRNPTLTDATVDLEIAKNSSVVLSSGALTIGNLAGEGSFVTGQGSSGGSLIANLTEDGTIGSCAFDMTVNGVGKTLVIAGTSGAITLGAGAAVTVPSQKTNVTTVDHYEVTETGDGPYTYTSTAEKYTVTFPTTPVIDYYAVAETYETPVTSLEVSYGESVEMVAMVNEQDYEPESVKIYVGGTMVDFDYNYYTFTISGLTGDAEVTATGTRKTMEQVDPGVVVAYDTAEEAEAAAAKIIAKPAEYIKLPPVSGSSTLLPSAYRALFTAKVVDGNKVVVTFTDAAAVSLTNQVNTTVKTIDPLTTDDETITTTPGLYYTILGGTVVGTITTEGTEVLADTESTTLSKPDLKVDGVAPTAAFYKIRVSEKALQTNE